jgi:DNA-binding NtrC family response regulator
MDQTSSSESRTPGILLVDDEPGILTLLASVLRDQGFSIWQAEDGQKALDLYQIHHASIALVILDVKMPRLDGPQTFAALKKLEPKIACCFMSGVLDRAGTQELLDKGALGVFPKPLDMKKVLDTVRQLVTGSEPE